MVQILQVKYVEGLRSFQRESIFCSKISSGGSLFIEKLVPEGTNFGGLHFYHDRTLLALNPGFPFWILLLSVLDFVSQPIFLQSCKTKSRTESLGLRLEHCLISARKIDKWTLYLSVYIGLV